MILSSTLLVQSVIAEPQVKPYEDLILQGDVTIKFSEVWDLTSCPLQVDFTYSGGGLIDDAGTHAIVKIGIRDVNINSGVWMLVDYSMLQDTLDPDPPGTPVWDDDDILMLQKADGEDQSSYDPPPVLGDSWVYPIYFDRDNVTPYQATNPLCIDGVTYNTQGEYHISLMLNAMDDNTGFAYMVVNGQTQGYIIYTDPYPYPETLPSIEIIVDDPEATYVGDWYLSDLVPGYYGDGYHFSWPGSGSDLFTWAFDLPYAGEWEVSAMWSNRSTRATNSPYTIYHAEGSDTVRVNQEVDGGEWNTLGIFKFDRGGNAIVLSDDADEAIIADAIKLTLVELTWPTISHSPAGITFTGDMANMQIFYELDSQGDSHTVEFTEIVVEGCITSLRERKEQTINVLNEVYSEEKKIEHRIDKMIDKIDKSLEEKLWDDEYSPASKHGKKVFDNEKKAVKEGMRILKDKKTTEDVKATVTQTINELVSVDLCFAEHQYQYASQYCGTKKVDHELKKAQKYLQKAYDELAKTKCKYDKVINNLKKSWEHSQKAIKHAVK